MKMRYSAYWICVLMVSILVGCSTHHVEHKQRPSMPFYYGELCTRPTQSYLVSYLRKAQVRVHFLGDHIFIVMPSRLLFKSHSSHLLESSHRVLRMVSQLLACYQKMSVEIVGYNSEFLNNGASQSLSQQQAEQVAHILWRSHIDSRLISGKGNGAATKYNEAGSCRIEIYTKKLP